MDYLLAPQLAEALHDLANDEDGLALGKSFNFILPHVLAQVALFAEVEDKVVIPAGFEGAVHVHEVLVLEAVHDAGLPLELAEHEMVVLELGLGDDFDGEEFLGRDVARPVDCSELALADFLFQQVVVHSLDRFHFLYNLRI